jgi:hypothetical protein
MLEGLSNLIWAYPRSKHKNRALNLAINKMLLS